MRIRTLMIVMLLLAVTSYVFAQDIPEPQIVEVPAADGLALIGDFYGTDSPAPAVLLMHMYNRNRGDWEPLISPLLEAGYAVLAVDLRGFGETKGSQDWEAATGDVQTWLDWLREQPNVRPEAVSIIGASIGANLTLIGCANDEQCVTAVALSPGLNYQGLEPESFVTDGLRERSALLIAAQGDRESSTAVKTMVGSARGEVGLQLYTGSPHGTAMFTPRLQDRVLKLIVDWLVEHTPAVEG